MLKIVIFTPKGLRSSYLTPWSPVSPSLPPSLSQETQIASLISVWARTGNHAPLSFSSWTHAHRGGGGDGGHQQLPLCYSLSSLKLSGNPRLLFLFVTQECSLLSSLASSAQSAVCPYPRLCHPIQYKLRQGLPGTELPPPSHVE